LNQVTTAKTDDIGIMAPTLTAVHPMDCCIAPEENAAIVVVKSIMKSFAAWAFDRSPGL